MKTPHLQGEFFDFSSVLGKSTNSSKYISLSPEEIKNWQLKINSHQENLFKGGTTIHQQTTLFTEITNNLIDKFEPLKLTPLPLSFWRLPKSFHQGPAVYVVMDQFDIGKRNLILYLGETISADQRWKGEHDCKDYIDNYLAALNKAGLSNHLSIRFWTDVPKETTARRRLEQELIQRWLPPFNKETRSRWQTPFTSTIQ